MNFVLCFQNRFFFHRLRFFFGIFHNLFSGLFCTRNFRFGKGFADKITNPKAVTPTTRTIETQMRVFNLFHLLDVSSGLKPEAADASVLQIICQRFGFSFMQVHAWTCIGKKKAKIFMLVK